MNSQPKYFFIMMLAFIAAISWLAYFAPAAQVETSQAPAPKYIFLFLATEAASRTWKLRVSTTAQSTMKDW